MRTGSAWRRAFSFLGADAWEMQINRPLTCLRRRPCPRALAEISHAFVRAPVRHVYEAPELEVCVLHGDAIPASVSGASVRRGGVAGPPSDRLYAPMPSAARRRRQRNNSATASSRHRGIRFLVLEADGRARQRRERLLLAPSGTTSVSGPPQQRPGRPETGEPLCGRS